MKREILLTKERLLIPCRLTEPEAGSIRRVVLGVHGLGGNAMDEIQTAIAEEMDLFYAATLRFDFPGHGVSPVDSSGFNLKNCKDSLLTVAEFAKRRYPEVADLCIFATGFGAYITFLCLEDLMALPGNVKLVVQTPSVRMHDTLLKMTRLDPDRFRERKEITFPIQPPLSISYDFYEDMKNNLILNHYPMPFLILHGEADDFIRLEDIHHLRRLNERSKLVIIPGTSHRFQEEGAWDMVLDLTRDWFEYEQVLVTDWE